VVYAQIEMSIHKLDKINYGQNFEPGKDDKYFVNNLIIPVNTEKVKGLSKAVFGYLPYWEYANGAQYNLKYDLLTHIACFDFAASTTGSLSNPSGWPWTSLINTAHSKGVKVIMCITNFDGDEIHTILTNATVKQTLIQNIITKIQTYNLDGVNIDFEGLLTADRGTVINSFMAELTNSVHTALPGKEVSFAGPAVNWSGWNFAGLANSCDYIFIMGYDFFGSWSTTSGPSAPLIGGSYNITNTVVSQYSSVVNSNPGKLILGVPYFGTHFITETELPGSKVTGYVNSPRFSSTYPASQSYGYIWNTTYKVPWYKYQESSKWHQVWFDDDSSLALKYDLAISKNLKGVGMWALNYDNGRNELWNLITRKFNSNFEPIPSTPVWAHVIGGNQKITVRTELPQYATGIRIYLSTDGINFSDSLYTTTSELTINGLQNKTIYYVKLKAFNSNGYSGFTETFGTIPNVNESSFLVVNGFDRLVGNDNKRNYCSAYLETVKEYFSDWSLDCTNNEAFYLDKISKNYWGMIWILGEESTADETFNQYEITKLKEYLNNGKTFFVSGSEIGWDLGRTGFSSANELDFYNNYLMAKYIADAPNNLSSTYYNVTPVNNGLFNYSNPFSFDNGTHGNYNTEYPDAIKPNKTAKYLAYYTGVDTALYGGAGIWNESSIKVGYLAFPLETVYPVETRNQLIRDVFEFLYNNVAVEDENIILEQFELKQNYPNPFNPATQISFSLQNSGFVNLTIYDILGKEVAVLVNDYLKQGKHSYTFNAVNLSSGIYFAKLTSGNLTKTIKMSLIK
jgi:spore germination protein YaaH